MSRLSQVQASPNVKPEPLKYVNKFPRKENPSKISTTLKPPAIILDLEKQQVSFRVSHRKTKETSKK
jgi:hypothetical protein